MPRSTSIDLLLKTGKQGNVDSCYAMFCFIQHDF